MSTDPKTIAASIRRVAANIDRDDRPSKSLVAQDVRRILAAMHRKADASVSLSVAGSVEIGGVDVHYSFTMVEKDSTEEIARFNVEVVLGSDLERRIAAGVVGDDLMSIRLESYKYRDAELAHTGEPGYIAGDPEIEHFGKFPNVLTKCLRDAMLTMGLSTLIGVRITDSSSVP